MQTGTYKLTNDFEASDYPWDASMVRDINFTPADKRLPDVAICRIYSNRLDAEIILMALINRPIESDPDYVGGYLPTEHDD